MTNVRIVKDWDWPDLRRARVQGRLWAEHLRKSWQRWARRLRIVLTGQQ